MTVRPNPIKRASRHDQLFRWEHSAPGLRTLFSSNSFQLHLETLKKFGDGGVDVTGAPNSQLVEGANNAWY